MMFCLVWFPFSSLPGLCDSLAGDLMVAKSFSVSGKCEFFSPRENIVTHSYTMVMQKNSPYRNLINFWWVVISLSRSFSLFYLFVSLSDLHMSPQVTGATGARVGGPARAAES